MLFMLVLYLVLEIYIYKEKIRSLVYVISNKIQKKFEQKNKQLKDHEIYRYNLNSKNILI